MKKKSNPRLNLIAFCFSLIAFLILAQILRVQHNPLMLEESIALEETYSYLPIRHEAERGRIYDIHGNLLAGSKTVYEIGIDLSVTEKDGRNPQFLANTILQFFGADYDLDPAFVNMATSMEFVEGEAEYFQFVVLNNIPQETIDELAILKEYYQKQREKISEATGSRKQASESTKLPSLDGLVWVPHLERYYPEGELASNILGFTTFLNLENKIGMFGIEENYQDKLLSEDSIDFLPRKPYEEFDLQNLPMGQSLILTIDQNIQEEVERILDEAVEDWNAQSGTIIVMDPKTGKIMAMASNPRANPNEYWNWDQAIGTENSYNKAIMDTYEPGSVFKIVTMAIGLESGAVTPDTIYNDTGSITIGGAEVTNWNYRGMGELDMGNCLKKSSNVCLAWVGNEKIGAEDFYNGLHNFGFDRRTNIDLAGEALYPLKEPGTDAWWPADLGRQAFGHGISVTPIQLITATSAIPNNGKIMAPHILNSVVIDGIQYDNIPQMIANPISKETAAEINEMLIISELQEETETWKAYIPGYTMCGKTGTAIIPIDANYYEDETNTSFVGWGPAEDPQFIIYVWLERPKPETFASIVAAPVFKEVAEYLITALNIPPDDIRLKLK